MGILVAAVTVLERAQLSPAANWSMTIIGLLFALFAGALVGVTIAAFGALFAALASLPRKGSSGAQALAASAAVLIGGAAVIILLLAVQVLHTSSVAWWVACTSTVVGSGMIALWVLKRVDT
ncbi:hypothetical protein [Agromyces sp. SYSU T0242]|uniref:hypothetical protein n=1 Tax=Agromyces litoreus TaxID=3158561 RepID=UPI0033952793